MISRYSNYFQKLLTSPSREARLLAHVVSRDPGSATAKNMKYIQEITSLSVWDFAPWKIKEALPVKTVPEAEVRRLRLLGHLLGCRSSKNVCVEDILILNFENNQKNIVHKN